jgi:hypothetical protein
MNRSSSIDTLKEMISLEEKRDALTASLDAIVERLDRLKDQLVSGSKSVLGIEKRQAPAAKPATPARRGGGRTRRGALAEKVLGQLRKAGSKGLKVREIADAVGTKPANIHSWFHSTMKRNKDIVRTDDGRYALAGAAASVKETPTISAAPAAKAKGAQTRKRGPRASAAAPAKPAAGRASRRGGRPGSLQGRIVSALQSSGSEGVSIKDLSNKLKVNNRNLYVWFATTGKKHPSVKKVGPGRYAYSGK